MDPLNVNEPKSNKAKLSFFFTQTRLSLRYYKRVELIFWSLNLNQDRLKLLLQKQKMLG